METRIGLSVVVLLFIAELQSIVTLLCGSRLGLVVTGGPSPGQPGVIPAEICTSHCLC